MYAFAVLLSCLLGAAAFMPSVVKTGSRMQVSMVKAPPGMKPMFDGTFKKAGEHLKEYVLENDNGARAVVDTETATAISWKTADGVERLAKAGTAHFINGAPIADHFVPEERAKKVSFDRMIFKVNPPSMPGFEYRCDVTLRADSLEYDVTIINTGAAAVQIQQTLKPHAEKAKIAATKIYENKGAEAATPSWSVAASKFKENSGFYVQLLPQ